MSKILQLIKVQEIDKEIYQDSKRLFAIPGEIQALKEAVNEKRGLLKEAEEELKAFQVRQKAQETELASKEENIKKLEAQLNMVKTNKEYSALQSEINGLKADDSMLEEQILKFMEEGDSYRQKIEEAKKIIADAEKEAAEKEKVLQDEKKQIESVVGELKAKKEDAIKNVDPDILSTYERILEKKDGVALVVVKDGGCGACGMQLRAQLIDELHMPDRVVVCENCSRILYAEDILPSGESKESSEA